MCGSQAVGQPLLWPICQARPRKRSCSGYLLAAFGFEGANLFLFKDFVSWGAKEGTGWPGAAGTLSSLAFLERVSLGTLILGTWDTSSP